MLGSGRIGGAMRHAAGFVVAFVVLTSRTRLEPGDVWAAYSIQGDRTITGESLPYLPLHWLGQAELGEGFTVDAVVPDWADPAATAVQLLVLAGVLALGSCGAASQPASRSPRWRRWHSCSRTGSSARSFSSCCSSRGRRHRPRLRERAGAAGARGRRRRGEPAQRVRLPLRAPGPSGIWEPTSALMFAVALSLTGWLLLAQARRLR